MKRHTAVLTALLLFAAALPAGAQQVADKKSLTLEGARQVIAAAEAEAKAKNAPGGVIAVVDDGGNLMALERLDGTFAAGATISIGKARTAVQFKRPTRFFEELINSSGKGRTVMTALPDFTPLIGGVPIVMDSQVVGGVGVSGAASAQQDEELAIAGASALANPMMAAPVSFFPADQVTAAFAKGAVLFGEDAGRSYMVHASRREAPGQAEVHTLDTDIIYVLDGTATFVTGGTVVEPKTVAPNEIRGSAIRDGQTHQLKKGDVIIVPNGTPHWFQQTTKPFLYYVVKAR
jgi:glc operon protein GlcG